MALAEEKIYTIDDIYLLPDGERAELIDGRIYFMDPPKIVHQKLAGELFFQLRSHIEERRGECQVLFSPVGVKLECDDKTLLEPDVIVVCDREKLHEDACYGAPDLVIEILSPSTQRHDRIIKFNLYQQAGVREYWIVDPRNKEVQSFVLVSGRYEAREFASAQDSIKVDILEDCWIDLTQVFSG